MEECTALVVGLGDPVSDILVRLDDAPFAARVFASGGIDEPGGCLPVNSDGEISKLLSLCGAGGGGGGGGEPKHCPGGSAANVTKGIANLGRAVQADPRLTPGWFQRLKLRYDEPLSNSTFNFNLRP